MIFLTTFIGFALGNFGYHTDVPNFSTALKRTYFQGNALLAVFVLTAIEKRIKL